MGQTQSSNSIKSQDSLNELPIKPNSLDPDLNTKFNSNLVNLVNENGSVSQSKLCSFLNITDNSLSQFIYDLIFNQQTANTPEKLLYFLTDISLNITKSPKNTSNSSHCCPFHYSLFENISDNLISTEYQEQINWIRQLISLDFLFYETIYGKSIGDPLNLSNKIIDQIKLIKTTSPNSPISQFIIWQQQNTTGCFLDLITEYLFSCLLSLTEEEMYEFKLFKTIPFDPIDDTDLDSESLYMIHLFCPIPKRTQWTLLYKGTEQGLSTVQFEYSVFKYKGPTLAIISCQPISECPAFKIGIYNPSVWKKQPSYFGIEILFFELSPYPECFIPHYQGKSPSPPTRLIHFSSSGLGIGGLPGKPREFRFFTDFSSGLYKCDPSKEFDTDSMNIHFPYPIGSNKSRGGSGFHMAFDVDQVIVYGLGNESTFTDYKKAWKFDIEDAEKRKNPHLDQDMNRIIFDMAGISNYSNQYGIQKIDD